MGVRPARQLFKELVTTLYCRARGAGGRFLGFSRRGKKSASSGVD